METGRREHSVDLAGVATGSAVHDCLCRSDLMIVRVVSQRREGNQVQKAEMRM